MFYDAKIFHNSFTYEFKLFFTNQYFYFFKKVFFSGKKSISSFVTKKWSIFLVQVNLNGNFSRQADSLYLGYTHSTSSVLSLKIATISRKMVLSKLNYAWDKNLKAHKRKEPSWFL